MLNTPLGNEPLPRHFGTDTVYASIPHRDAMLVFPQCAGGKLQAYRDMIADHDSDGDQPLTFTLFEVSPNGVRAMALIAVNGMLMPRQPENGKTFIFRLPHHNKAA